MNKKTKFRQLAPCYLKLSKDGLMQDGVQNVYLEDHPIWMNIQSGPNAMDHGPTTSFNRHLKLIQ